MNRAFARTFIACRMKQFCSVTLSFIQTNNKIIGQMLQKTRPPPSHHHLFSTITRSLTYFRERLTAERRVDRQLRWRHVTTMLSISCSLNLKLVKRRLRPQLRRSSCCIINIVNESESGAAVLRCTCTVLRGRRRRRRPSSSSGRSTRRDVNKELRRPARSHRLRGSGWSIEINKITGVSKSSLFALQNNFCQIHLARPNGK